MVQRAALRPYTTRLGNGGKMPITTLKELMGHRRIDTTMAYTKIHDETLQGDYEAAIACLQARLESSLDWDLWGPAIEAAFQTEATTTDEIAPITNQRSNSRCSPGSGICTSIPSPSRWAAKYPGFSV